LPPSNLPSREFTHRTYKDKLQLNCQLRVTNDDFNQNPFNATTAKYSYFDKKKELDPKAPAVPCGFMA
jgi:hypothetical protein